MITENRGVMRSDATDHSARFVPDPDGDGQAGAWISTRLGQRRCTADEARDSLALAELEHAGWAASPNAASLRAQLGLTG